MRIVFPYFAQFHQIFHSLPIAAAMSARFPDSEVHVAATTPAHLGFIRKLIEQYAPGTRLYLDQLETPMLRQLPHKKRSMFKNRRYFRSFNAIVTPERTSLFMRRIGLGATRLIWTRHGAGDRAVGFSPDVRDFDFVLLAGRKIERRLLDAHLIHPGRYVSGVYAKFDWLNTPATSEHLFDNDRPTVLYNPHFQTGLSSWLPWGRDILDFFARSERYNLVFAPHVRLFGDASVHACKALEPYRRFPHLRIDLGSEHSIDMTYLRMADVYLGDVSSQACEFVCRPRPCLFLNAHNINWQGNPDFLFWTLGPVIDRLGRLESGIEEALAQHAHYRPVQENYVQETFGIPENTSSSAHGADAILEYLRHPAGDRSYAQSA
jgi:hypothetical protein